MLTLNSMSIHYNQSLGTAFEQLDFEFNLSFEGGKIHAIIGRSGAGKSTLLNLISGFATPQSGVITWNEKPISQLEPHLRPITSLFQEHNLFAHLNVYDNIALGLEPSLTLNHAQQQLVTDAIKNVGLSQKTKQLPKDLSGGEAQRVALARALARAQDLNNPRELLLLDEPFSALDPETRQEMRQLIKDIQIKHGLTIIIISHNPQEMLHFADSLSLIKNGQIIAHHLLSNASKLPSDLDSFINI